jgi:hypothetical protein
MTRTKAEIREIERYGSTYQRVAMFVDSLRDLGAPEDVIVYSLETHAGLARRKSREQ